jgi:hypothetical protein
MTHTTFCNTSFLPRKRRETSLWKEVGAISVSLAQHLGADSSSAPYFFAYRSAL